ncbi:unnamed protein product [Alternaria alternata]
MPADQASLVETKEEIPYHTQYYRKRGRPSMKEKAQGQQYLTPPEEKALVAFILRIGAVGTPIRVKYIPALAFCIASRRATKRPSEPPKKNWPQAFRRRHPQLKSRNNRPMPWERHDNSIYNKVVHWFNVIKEELCRPDVLPENVYNMDKTGIMLSMLGAVKVLVGKNDGRDYRGTGTKRTMVTAIECVSASALDQNYIGLLKAANNEAKTRRNTKSDILKKPRKNGEGRVMRQEDLKAIRADRAECAKQDAAKKAAGKAKRGRPKATTQADGGESGKKRGRKRKSVAAGVLGPSDKAARASDALIDPMLETWRAPVAQMW